MPGMWRDGTFFLHEDEWGMIDIMPIENLKGAGRIAHDAKEYSDRHFDGFGWTDMFLIPEPSYPLVARQIPLSYVRELARSYLTEADKVESGIRPGEVNPVPREGTARAFAFCGEDEGVLYGTCDDGVIHHLHFVPPCKRDPQIPGFWLSALTALGSRYRLMVGDWWSKTSVDLSDTRAVQRYLDERQT